MPSPYPFSAIVGQEEMRLCLLLTAVDAGIGGVLAFGDRGTGKSTAVRGLSGLLPPIPAHAGCRFNCDPAGEPGQWCESCRAGLREGTLKTVKVPVPVVDLPLGATEDRVAGALDLEQALVAGRRVFEPGLLASAHRGFLYVDEVNLLEDHLVDLLLDVAASGVNIVEREGLSLRHPARFVLVGSGNPEEGELRPQLLDRFGLSATIVSPTDLKLRVEVVKRRTAFDRDPEKFVADWKGREARERGRLAKARARLAEVETPDALLETAAALCMRLGIDGLRGELTLVRAARALAALEGATQAAHAHLARVAQPALSHRLRRDPLDEAGTASRVGRAMAEMGLAA